MDQETLTRRKHRRKGHRVRVTRCRSKMQATVLRSLMLTTRACTQPQCLSISPCHFRLLVSTRCQVSAMSLSRGCHLLGGSLQLPLVTCVVRAQHRVPRSRPTARSGRSLQQSHLARAGAQDAWLCLPPGPPSRGDLLSEVLSSAAGRRLFVSVLFFSFSLSKSHFGSQIKFAWSGCGLAITKCQVLVLSHLFLTP